MKHTPYVFIALAILSATVIALQLAVMRSFSIGSWSNFGHMVISIALLGFGLAGTLASFIQEKIKKFPSAWLAWLAILFLPSMALAHVLAQQIPFNPLFITTDPIQILYVALYYLVYAIPFFIGALYINATFVIEDRHVHSLYFWNMLGSGLGGIFILVMMYFVPPDYLTMPLLVLSSVAIFFTLLSDEVKQNNNLLINRKIIFALGLSLVSFLVVGFWGEIKVSPYKSISYARQFPDARLSYYSFGPTGEYHLYASSFFHFAPGLSDVASLELKRMPKNAYRGLYIDGGGPIGVMKKLDVDESAYIHYLPMSAPYQIKQNPKVFLIKLGGGISTNTALFQGANSVHVVEPNPTIIQMMAQDPNVVRFNGNLLRDSRVRVTQGEPRIFAASEPGQYDIVEISLIDGVGLSQAGGYSVDENFTYTVEAINDYMRALKPEGIISITVWNKLMLSRNVSKLLSTVVEALRTQGVPNPENRVFVFDLLLQTATILVKNSDFTVGEVSQLTQWCQRMSFQVAYAPGMEHRQDSFDNILLAFESAFKAPKEIDIVEDQEESDKEPTPDLYPNNFYHHSLFYHFLGKSDELYNKYIFDIRPVTDDKPYYTAYMKPERLGDFIDQLNEVPEEWGYFLQVATLFISILFGLLIILLPLWGNRHHHFRSKKGTFPVILYYACLGLGYMMVEIFLIQRLAYFLSDPIFSVSIVILSMLIASGLGSLFAGDYQYKKDKLIRFAALGIALGLCFYVFVLPSVINLTIGWPFVLKVLLTVIMVAPVAFLMGMPFPSGLSVLSRSRPVLVPWALGINGGLSVTGSVLTKLMSISFGFSTVLLTALGLYLLAGMLFPSNQLSSPSKG